MGFLTVLKKMRQKEKEMRILLLWVSCSKFHLFTFWNLFSSSVDSITLARRRFSSGSTESRSIKSRRHSASTSRLSSTKVRIHRWLISLLENSRLFQATHWISGMLVARSPCGRTGGTTSRAQMAWFGWSTQLTGCDWTHVAKSSMCFCSKSDSPARPSWY